METKQLLTHYRGCDSSSQTMTKTQSNSAHLPSIFNYWLIGAAVVVCALCMFLFQYQYYGDDFSLRIANEEDYNRTISLPDGSNIVLGESSSVFVHITDTIRHVTLEQGKAYFSVAPNTGVPFVVLANATSVSVFGTEFEVHKGAENVRVAVAEGHVKVSEVYTVKNGNHSEREAVSVYAGEQVEAGSEGQLSPKTHFDEADLSWK